MNVTISSPFPIADAPRVWAWMQPFQARVSDDFSPKTMDAFVRWFIEQSEGGMKTWGVYRDGELGGVISFQQISPVVGTAQCVFKKEFWGHGTSIPAMQEATNEMFLASRKLSLSVLIGNKAMISLMKKLGAKQEGVLRSHTTRGGKPLDIVMLALFPAHPAAAQ